MAVCDGYRMLERKVGGTGMLLSWGKRAGEICRQRMLSCFV
jgi:hypothetical protein